MTRRQAETLREAAGEGALIGETGVECDVAERARVVIEQRERGVQTQADQVAVRRFAESIDEEVVEAARTIAEARRQFVQRRCVAGVAAQPDVDACNRETARVVVGRCGVQALRQPRLKPMIAYSTVAQLGYLMIALPLAGGLLVAAAWICAMIVATDYPERPLRMFYHSTFIMVWAMFGAVASVLMTRAALEHLPYRGPNRGAGQPRRPVWLHLVPLALFVACTSPYIGLKTESSINMFSNLHTEGGETNHLLFAKPPYLFGYQEDVVEILDSSHPYLLHLRDRGERMVLYALKDVLRRDREHWVTYRLNGLVEAEVTHASVPAYEQPSLLERAFLIFKTVDVRRPKVCTH